MAERIVIEFCTLHYYVVLLFLKILGRIEGSCAAMPPKADKIFVGCYDCNMYAISALEGDILWMYKTDGIIKCTPSVTAEYLIFGKCIR